MVKGGSGESLPDGREGIVERLGEVEEQVSNKKAYQPPTLVVYGNICDLTQNTFRNSRLDNNIGNKLHMT
jgi:hypothetical protein